jgi:syntaxin-binding protein 1
VDDLKVLELSGVGSRTIPNGLREAKDEERAPQEYYDQKYFTKDAPTAPVAPRVNVAPPKLDKKTASNPSVNSLNSMTPSMKEDKKKKKGFFHF